VLHASKEPIGLSGEQLDNIQLTLTGRILGTGIELFGRG
jgi:hypothetical protein